MTQLEAAMTQLEAAMRDHDIRTGRGFDEPKAGAPVYSTVQDSPLGEILLTSDGTSLTGLHLETGEEVRKRVRTAFGCELTPDDSLAVFTETMRQLGEYFAGTRREFTVALAPRGTAFQLQVWQGLTTIGYGQTNGYGELAAALGRPKAARAVGAANGKNPISIIVPCHRVVGANGTLTGYAWGEEKKRRLLDLEQGRGL